MSARKLTYSALFIVIAAALSVLETWLPPIVPIPAVRVGLGNVVTLLLLNIGGIWKVRDALCVALLRCVISGLVTGSVMSMMFGLVGGAAALASMAAMGAFTQPDKRTAVLPFQGIAGAICHVGGQLLTAALFYGTWTVFAYAPILLATAIIGGAFTGLVTKLFLTKAPKKVLDNIKNV